MSCYDWEQGEILLPTADVKKVRDALNAAQNMRHSAARDAIEQLWKGLRTRSQQGRIDLIHDMMRRDPLLVTDPRHEAREMFIDLGGAKPRLKDLERRGLGKATSRTTHWHQDDFFAHLEGRTLTYGAWENNHAVEHAHNTTMYKAMIAVLRNIVWTHGSGGTVVGNDEYNSDSLNVEGGGNYVTDVFGPRGGDPAGKSRAQIIREMSVPFAALTAQYSL